LAHHHRFIRTQRDWDVCYDWLRMAHPQQRPVKELFDKVKRVFQFEAANVGTPYAG
jgi:hypothetical protein